MIRSTAPRLALPTWLALLALLTAGGCVTPGLPTGGSTTSVTSNALERTQELYLYPERLDARVMVGALDALEQRFDPVRFDAQDGDAYGTLLVRSQSARVPLEESLVPEHFESVLGRALLFVEEGLGPEELEAGQGPDDDLELIALRGALGSLDRYSTVFSGRGSEDFQIRFSGKLRGIGARIGRRDGTLTAVKVFEISPAARAGLQDDDSILGIDGKPTRTMSVRDAVSLIRGEEGSIVVLTIGRKDEEEVEVVQEVEITRGEVVVPSVEAENIGEGIGYARITSMARTTLKEFRTKVAALGPLNGLVLDLRGNSGGSMISAAKLADLFLEEGVIVRIVDRDGDGQGGGSRAVARPGVLLGAQVVILVDPQTASAAEILSGALAPLPRVTIIGQTTFGKGLIQRVMPLPQDNLLKLTVGEYLLSDDRAIHKKGVEPDVVLMPVFEQRLGALAAVPDDALPYLRTPEEADDFPRALAADMIRMGKLEALELARNTTRQQITEALAEHGVRWSVGPDADARERLELPTVELSSAPLVSGRTGAVTVRVQNPNDTDLENVWLALRGPATYLSNRLVALGTVPAHGSAEGEIELTPSDGLFVDPLNVRALVASGSSPLLAERQELRVEHRSPQLEIEVVRTDEATVSVTVRNQGCCDPGEIRVAVPGTSLELEALAPGGDQTLELPIAGDVRFVSVLLSGAGVQRRIEVPLPAERISVVPPEVELERSERLGQTRVQVHAQSPEGLREGWLALDGQKEIYVAWEGSNVGLLRADLDGGVHSLTTKVKTLSGVSVIDTRRLTTD